MELRDNRSRLKLAMRIMVVAVIADAIGVLLSLISIKFVGDIESGNYSESDLEIFDLISLVYGIGYLIVIVLTIILFIMWFRRAYYNVTQFALTPPRFTEGWAAGAWFVPILSLFRPVQIMREIWLETIAYLRNRSPLIPKTNIQSLISLWWGFWIVGNIIGNVSWRIPDDSLDMLRTGYYFDLVSGIFMVPAGIFIIQIMREYGTLEEELHIVQNVEGESDSIFY